MNRPAKLNEEEWKQLLQDTSSPVVTVSVTGPVTNKWGSYSRPCRVLCSDGREYVVKGQQPKTMPTVARVMVNDQVVGRLGMAMGAPVAEVDLVDLSADMIAVAPELKHMEPGIVQASLVIDNTSDDRQRISYSSVPENRERFGSLAVLYGLCSADDHQFIYNKTDPRLVHSYDHGHFFPGGVAWDLGFLAGTTQPATVDPKLTADCALTPEEIATAALSLLLLTNEALGAAVKAPPDEWGIRPAERLALAQHIANRRDELILALVPEPPADPDDPAEPDAPAGDS